MPKKKKNAAAVALAKQRAKQLGKKRTKEIASQAAKSRWEGKSEEEKREIMAKVAAGRRRNAKPDNDL